MIFRAANYGMVSTDDAVYVFAIAARGWTKAIHKFQDDEWTVNIGSLQTLMNMREGIQIGNDLLIIGGDGGGT